jgi:S-adenosylmethionine:tRNA ribosyltransferase-isomerase
MTGLRVEDFDYDLPPELIAQQPPAERGQSRMLVMNRATGAVRDTNFAEFLTLLQSGDLLVLNDSRVIPARLYARRMKKLGAPGPGSPQTGLRLWGGDPSRLGTWETTTGRVEVMLTEPASPQMPRAPSIPRSSAEWVGNHESPDASDQKMPRAPSIPRSSAEWVGNHESHPVSGENLWRALVHPGRKIGVGERLIFLSPSGSIELEAEVLERNFFGSRLLRFNPVDDFFAVLERIGHTPLPPYIRRDDVDQDRERYQTVYSHERGSVAAPTAGLHFTPQILEELTVRGVEVARITLHVGLGTFAPLRVERVDEVRLHRERYTLSPSAANAINNAARSARRIVAVGTTVVRTLEHCAQQAKGCPLEAHSGETEIFISPGFEFRLVGALLTNFHLPQSSLLMLVSAFAGRKTVLAAYRHAVQERYRFFSYGDCMFLE